jgi:predicted aspartyl protease
MMRIHPLTLVPGLALAAGLVLAAGPLAPARADWLQPDPSFREAQLTLRLAVRDTAGQPLTALRLDSLAVAHLRLGNLDEAQRLFTRVVALAPTDEAAAAGLGKIALFRGSPALAESLLAPVAGRVDGAAEDLLAARLRLGHWEEAATLAEESGQAGRAALLRRLAEPEGAWKIQGPGTIQVSWIRCWPVPIVKAKLNGQSVLLGIDTGTTDLILDPSVARRCGVTLMPEQLPVLWNGTRVAARVALVERLELGGLRIERIPAAATSLRRWSLEVNPGSERVAGVIGLNLLSRFTPTLDYHDCALVLRPAGTAITAGAGALRIPFELWGERELTVYGSLNGGRRMAMVLQTGMPGCGVGAPPEVFEEVGVRPGAIARAMRSAGSRLQANAWAGVQVATVTVGPIVKDKVAGWAGALDSAELWRHGVRRDALLSSDFLRGRSVTIDWQKQELVIE